LAHFGHAAIAELSPVSGIRRKLDFEPAKGSFWRAERTFLTKITKYQRTSNGGQNPQTRSKMTQTGCKQASKIGSDAISMMFTAAQVAPINLA
jgi:hypothetical protein